MYYKLYKMHLTLDVQCTLALFPLNFLGSTPACIEQSADEV